MASRDIHVTPGTVSRILWHFTGGPTWNKTRLKQSSRRKPTAKAYDNLVSILRSRELRIGNYSEVARVTIPEVRQYDRDTKTVVTKHNVKRRLTSAPVCCLADIPIAHLSYHAKRYGKFALGFHREAAIAHGFNPVLYTLENTNVIQSVYAGLSAIEDMPWENATYRVDDAVSEASSLEMDNEDLYVGGVESAIEDIRTELSEIASAQKEAFASIEMLLAFVKTFDPDEFDSVYCEREWRTTRTFKFRYNNLAMVVVPKSVRDKEYFRPFCSRTGPKMKFPRTVPVVPWEDLVEH